MNLPADVLYQVVFTQPELAGAGPVLRAVCHRFWAECATLEESRRDIARYLARYQAEIGRNDQTFHFMKYAEPLAMIFGPMPSPNAFDEYCAVETRVDPADFYDHIDRLCDDDLPFYQTFLPAWWTTPKAPCPTMELIIYRAIILDDRQVIENFVDNDGDMWFFIGKRSGPPYTAMLKAAFAHRNIHSLRIVIDIFVNSGRLPHEIIDMLCTGDDDYDAISWQLFAKCHQEYIFLRTMIKSQNSIIAAREYTKYFAENYSRYNANCEYERENCRKTMRHCASIIGKYGTSDDVGILASHLQEKNVYAAIFISAAFFAHNGPILQLFSNQVTLVIMRENPMAWGYLSNDRTFEEISQFAAWLAQQSD